MSHFYLTVLFPAGTAAEQVDDLLAVRMAPFDENTDVPEYDRPCYCISRVAQHAGYEAAEAVKPLTQLRVEYAQLSEPPDWAEFIKEWHALNEQVAHAHPLWEKPDPACEDCHGTGFRKSTYNPKSKWDWFRIGGRWDGEITGVPAESDDNGFNFADQYESVANNMRPVAELPPEFSCFAVLTPDGEWIERGQMGWWGMAHNEAADDVWAEQLRTIFERYRDCLAVGVDCHI